MGSNLGQSLGPPFSQSLLFCPCSSYRQEEFWVRVFNSGIEPHPSTWCPVFLLEVDSTSYLFPLRVFRLSSLPLSPESLTSQVFGILQRFPSHLPRLPVSILSSGPQDFSPVFPPPIPDYVPFPTPCLLSHPDPYLPLPPMIAFSSPKTQDILQPSPCFYFFVSSENYIGVCVAQEAESWVLWS